MNDEENQLDGPAGRPRSLARPVILLRVGEIFLKGRNRPFFMRQLARNVAAAVSGIDDVETEVLHDRLLVWHAHGQAPLLLMRLKRVFGLTGLSPGSAVQPDLDAMTAAALQEARSFLSEHPSKSFRIRARRSDKSFPTKSMELARLLGGAVFEATGLAVKLVDPDMTVEVEVAANRAFVFSRRVEGPGGLPVGVSGQATLLLSGGIDSPVAGWLLMKRGLSVHAVTFQSPPYTGSEALQKVLDLCSVLAGWGGSIRLHVVRFTEAQQEIRRHCPEELAVILYRRAMLRTAFMLARYEGSAALATGESLGQVASQTIENMTCIEQSVLPKEPTEIESNMLVLRPLITFDKVQTTELARKIGTFDISIRPHEDCCSLFVPRHPETRARLADVIRAEGCLPTDPEKLAQELARDAELRTCER